MGGFGYDRQVFVKPKETPPSGRSPLPGALVLILVAALGAFAAYRYIKAGGLSNVDPDTGNAQIKQLQKKIDVLQARIDELEKKRHRTPHAEDLNPPEAKPKAAPAQTAVVSPPPVVPAPKPPAPKALAAVSSLPQATPAAPPAADSKTEERLNLLKGDLASSHQEWQATVNRLGNVVGELDSQRNLVKQNQSDVNQLLRISRRTGVPFALKKGSRYQRVGPISIKLASTDVSNQRYTLRMIVDDKSVELKDRALNEVVQFFTTRSQYPVELVVSQIHKGRVKGMLAVPNDLNPANENARMRPQ